MVKFGVSPVLKSMGMYNKNVSFPNTIIINECLIASDSEIEDTFKDALS